MHVHNHKPSRGWVVKAAVVVTIGLVVTEFVAGHLAHSLALISDGWHNLTDIPTLIFSWLALYLERKPPDYRKTYGYQRAGVLAAFVNGLILIAVAIYICFEGYERVIQPQQVAVGPMLIVGVVALVINGSITLGLVREAHDLNIRSVFIHNLGDALSNVAIIVGAFLIRYTGQPLIDPLLGFLIAGMIFWGALGIIMESSNILLESLPKGMSLDGIATAVLRVPGVREVHDVHVWSLGSESHAMSCHVGILDMATSENETIAHQIREIVASEFGITHTTVQFEHQHEPGAFHKYMPGPAGRPAKSSHRRG
ncbi:MAG TPA: cation diffusion facilitator family transporter [Terriglobia bacterium]|nr:cation diffusion facilitator family transporter [Terriglobia bacterium]